MSSFANDIRNFYNQSDALNKLISINVVVFVLINIIRTVEVLSMSTLGIYSLILQHLQLPAYGPVLLRQPWTFISYMFLHVEFLHILFNLLWLYWIGGIFADMLGSQRLLGMYISGGLAGAILYILAYNVFPVFAEVLPHAGNMGASAAIMAIIIGTATLVPRYNLRLLLFGNVELRWIALAYVVLDVIGIGISNPGGHFAHLGGALWGFVGIKALQKGSDIVSWPANFLYWIRSLFSPNKSIRLVHRNPEKVMVASTRDKREINRKRDDEEELNRILDKISDKGYNSLSKEEKEYLFKFSNK